MFKRAIIVFCVILSMNHMHGMQFLKTYFSPLRFDKKEVLTSELEKVAQRFTPPKEVQEIIAKEVQEIIEKNKELIVGGKVGFQGFRVNFIKDENGLPLLLPKGKQIDRVINADRVRTCIKQNKFTTIEVPEKYVYPVDNQFTVFAQRVDARELNKGEISLKEIKELASFVERTGYWDIHERNILRNKQNSKLTIVDIEDKSFATSSSDDLPSKVECVHNLGFWFKDFMSQEAKDWHKRYLGELSNSLSGDVKIGPLAQYDTVKVNVDKAKKELDARNTYNSSLARLDKCIADADGNREDITPFYCSTWIKELKESNDELAREHNCRRNDIVGKRKEFIKYLKSITGKSPNVT